MLPLDISDPRKYNILLSYIFEKCDEVSFYFPIFDENTVKIPTIAQDYIKYKSAKCEFLKELFNHGAHSQFSRRYQGMKMGFDMQIINVPLYNKLYDKFKEYHFYNWQWFNNLPEDPCFFYKKKCRFLTVSHEEMFFVCDKQLDSLVIKQLGE